MQYKKTIKILIDKRKLDILKRLNCPIENIIELILNNNLILTGDELIDENLETLIDYKEFENWGGKRKGSGRHKKNQLEIQDDNQLENQDINQVVDIDKDIDIDIDNNKNNNKKIDIYINKYKVYFENEYKRIFKHKPFLSMFDCRRIIELSSQYDETIITQAIEKLKNINFEGIDFKPTANWLLKDNNFERVMNGEFDKEEVQETDFKY